MTAATILELPDRVLVVGAAGGIGRAIATRLTAAGADVIGSDRNSAPSGWTGTWIAADITNPSDRNAVVEAAGSPIGGLVLAAGILDPEEWERIDDAAALRLLAINVVGPGLLVRELRERMTHTASVVFLGSVAGLRASPKTPFYAASKAAVRNLAASLSLLLEPWHIRVNVLAPGLIDTPLTDALNVTLAAERGIDARTVAAERAAAVPQGRAGTTDEMADACLFLLSRQAGYLTGSTLFATGGAMAGTI